MNYGSGNGEIIPTTTDPLHFAQNASLVTDHFSAPRLGGVSNPHMALEHGKEVLVPDLVSVRPLRPSAHSYR
jgi:hypothetical protein